MFRIYLLITTAVLAVAVTAVAQPSVGKPFDLKVGQSVVVAGQELTVGFEELLGEGRCPIGVLCIWEGDAAVRIWASLPGASRGDFQLHTHHDYKWKFSYGDYEVTLLEVSPYPVYEAPTPPGDYVVTVQVDGGPAPVEDSTWGRIKALYEPLGEDRR
jgi:hypothetical protein